MTDSAFTLAVIGGTGLEALGDRPEAVLDSAETPYGPASAIPTRFAAFPDAVFLNRHGDGHVLLPHEINYRANIWLLNELGVGAIVAVFAVGGIAPSLKDGTLALATQIVDYTWGREHTFSTRENLYHADFSEPFDAGLRGRLHRCGATRGRAAGGSRRLRRHARAALRDRGGDRSHGARRLHRGWHDGHAGSRSCTRTGASLRGVVHGCESGGGPRPGSAHGGRHARCRGRRAAASAAAIDGVPKARLNP